MTNPEAREILCGVDSTGLIGKENLEVDMAIKVAIEALTAVIEHEELIEKLRSLVSNCRKGNCK